MRDAGLGRVERLRPVGGAQLDPGPRGLDRHRVGGDVLVEPDGRLDRLHQVGRRLQPGHLGVGLRGRRGPLRDQVPERAGLHALLAEARQHVGDVGQVGLVGADEQHPAVAVAEARVGVQQVGAAVQRDDGLAGAGAAVDDEGAARSGPDDRVLVGRDGAEHVPHPGRPVAAEAGDERGLVVERGVPLQPVGGEHLVPVVADPAPGPAIPAAAGQAHRVGVGRAEERLGDRGPPVDQQPAAGAVGQAEPPDVDRLRVAAGAVVGADHPPEAQVEAEPAQGPQPGRQPVHLGVPVHRLLADAAGRPELGLEAAGEVGDRLLEGVRDRREVPLVGGDQRRVGLGGETVGKVKGTRGQWVHPISSDVSAGSGSAGASLGGRLYGTTGGLRQARGSAIS